MKERIISVILPFFSHACPLVLPCTRLFVNINFDVYFKNNLNYYSIIYFNTQNVQIV